MKANVYKSFAIFTAGFVVLIAVAASSRDEKDAPVGAAAKTTDSPKGEQQAAPQHRGPITDKQRQAIQNNLRLLGHASDSMYLEHGKMKTEYNELVGPDKYLLKVDNVAGEDYRKIHFERAKPLSVTTASGEVVTTADSSQSEEKVTPPHLGPITDKHRQAIQNNLRQLAAAADSIYLQNGKMKTEYNEIVGPDKYILKVGNVAGEDYRKIHFEHGKPISVTTASGEVVTLGR